MASGPGSVPRMQLLSDRELWAQLGLQLLGKRCLWVQGQAGKASMLDPTFIFLPQAQVWSCSVDTGGRTGVCCVVLGVLFLVP